MATLSQMEYIVTVQKLRHFSKAARACRVSQPSLSSQIRKVEEEIGFPLFDRRKTPIEATEKGAIWIEQASIVLCEEKKLVELGKSESTLVSGSLRLGIIPTVAPYLLPRFIGKFSKAYPKVNLKIDEIKTETMIQDLENDTLDAGVLAGPLSEKNIKEEILYVEPFYLFVGKHSPLSAKKKIHEDDLDGSQLWLLKDGHCFRDQIVKLCSLRSKKNVFPNIAFESGNLETLTYLVKHNAGYTLVPELFVNTLPNNERTAYVREFVAPIPSRKIVLAFHKNQWRTNILSALKQSVQSSLDVSPQLELDPRKYRVLGI